MESGSVYVPRSLISRSFLAIYWQGRQPTGSGRNDRRTHIVVAAEKDQQHADSGRKQKQTIFSECVREQLATSVACADLVKSLFAAAIERGQVDVRRCVVDMHFVVLSTKYAITKGSADYRTVARTIDRRVDDQCCEREHHAGKTGGVRNKLDPHVRIHLDSNVICS